MNRKETSEAIKVMQAWCANEACQVRCAGEIEWRLLGTEHQGVTQPSWDWGNSDYRIKPVEPREFWVEVCDGAIYHIWRNRPINIAGEVIKVREVIE